MPVKKRPKMMFNCMCVFKDDSERKKERKKEREGIERRCIATRLGVAKYKSIPTV